MGDAKQAERLTARTETALDEARVALGAPPDNESAWRDAVVEALDQLGAAFDAHVARSSGPTGFIATSEVQAPRLIRALEVLDAEHGVLRAEISEARDAVAHAANLDAVDGMEHLIALVDATLLRVDMHLVTANRLALEIANRDFGPGD